MSLNRDRQYEESVILNEAKRSEGSQGFVKSSLEFCSLRCSGSGGHGENLGPPTLDGRDGLKFRNFDGDFISK